MSDKNLIRLSRITSPGADDKQFPTQQMEYLGKVADGIMVYPYGMHANVPADTLTLMLSVQNLPDNRFSIPFNTSKRPKLAEGEVAFFHPPTDAFIIWRANGDLDIETGNGGTANVNIKCASANITASKIVEFTAPLTKVNGAFEVTGAAAFGGTMTNSSVNVGGTHVHTQGVDSDNDTQQNTGVPQ